MRNPKSRSQFGKLPELTEILLRPIQNLSLKRWPARKLKRMEQAMKKGLVLYTLLLTMLSGCQNKQRREPELELFTFAGKRWAVPLDNPDEFPDTNRARLARAKTLLNKKHYQEAKDCLRLLDGTPSEPQADFLYGVALTHQGKASIAESYFTSAIDEKPDNSLFRVALIWNLCQQEKFDRAEDEAETAAGMTTNDAVWHVLHHVRELRRKHRVTRTLKFVGILIGLGVIALLAVVLLAHRTRRSPCPASKC